MTRTTTSTIDYLSINENFPVAGEDNDTQVFRDNFDTIKTSLRSAQEDVTDIKTNGAFLDQENSFQGNEISTAVLRDITFRRFDIGIPPGVAYTVDYENGSYQSMKLGEIDLTIDFQNFPDLSNGDGTGEFGLVRLELSITGSSKAITFISSDATVFRVNNDFPTTSGGGYKITLTSQDNPVILDVWRHNATNMFMHYYGKYEPR
jgi:hypothetical protein